MYETNVELVLRSLRPADVVLDIGGWASPFNRANYLIDAMPYATRGFYRTFGMPASQGGDVEFFSADTWIQRDICDRAPFPFGNKEIDFVICSHTLEDIRDPLWVCSEMIRIAKRGYIEVPSRIAESSRGWEHPRIAGLSHHRWLIDIDHDSIRFIHKFHAIHSHWRFSLPGSFLRSLPVSRTVQWLFWENTFEFSEEIINGPEAQEAELATFVERVHPYSRTRLRVDAIARAISGLARRVHGKALRTMAHRDRNATHAATGKRVGSTGSQIDRAP